MESQMDLERIPSPNPSRRPDRNLWRVRLIQSLQAHPGIRVPGYSGRGLRAGVYAFGFFVVRLETVQQYLVSFFLDSFNLNYHRVRETTAPEAALAD